LDITRFGAALLLSIQVFFESAEMARVCDTTACAKLLPDIVVVNLFNFRMDAACSPEVLVSQGMKAFGSYF
jgi:hypothetical protein